MKGRPALLLLLTLVLASVSCKPAPRKIIDALESSASWVATAQEVGAGWVKHEHPVPYSLDSLEMASEELTKARKTIRESAATAPSVAPGDLDPLLERADRTILAMAEGIRGADSTVVLARRSDLFEIEKRVRAMSESAQAAAK